MSSLFQGIIRIATNVAADVADVVQTETDPKYRQMKKEMGLFLHAASAGALVTGVISVVSGIGGLGYCIAGRAGQGVRLLTSSAVTTWLCFNLYKISENAQQIAQNPRRYMPVNTIDARRVQEVLKKDTFYFGPLIDWMVWMVVQEEN